MPIGATWPGQPAGPALAPRLLTGVDTLAGPTQPIGRGAGPLALVEYGSVPLESAPADADGLLEVLLPAAATEHALLVERISLSTTSVNATAVSVYLGAVTRANRVDYSDSGDDNVADYGPPLLVPGGTELRLRWTGASAGSTAVARIQYQRVVMGGGA